MSEYLLINNNNTRTKLALASSDALEPDRASILTAELDPMRLHEVTVGWSFERLILASVVPKKAAVVRESFSSLPILEISSKIQLGIDLDFPEPDSIGADRLANAAAVVRLFKAAPAVVVDFGTAVTFDIISASGAYVGGIIAPGLELMTTYLHEKTALLPLIEIEEPARLIGKSTREAMLSGAVHGYRGMIEGILERLQNELSPAGDPVKIVATGGYAQLISRAIPAIEAVLPDLTLEGMRLIANQNP